MKLLDTMQLAASGLSAQRARLDAAAENVANAQTTKTADGGPYRAKRIAFQTVGDEVQAVETRSEEPPRLEYDPSHPDADEHGYVAYPDIAIVEEMVDMVTASRAYEAGLTTLEAAVSMAERALGMGG